VVAFSRAPFRRNLLDELLVLTFSEESAKSVYFVLEEPIQTKEE
jgi:hypothetical protein